MTTMRFQQRYEYTDRDERGKLSCVGRFSSPEEFDRFIAQYPPQEGHTLTLCDLCSPLDDFGLTHETVREITG